MKDKIKNEIYLEHNWTTLFINYVNIYISIAYIY